MRGLKKVNANYDGNKNDMIIKETNLRSEVACQTRRPNLETKSMIRFPMSYLIPHRIFFFGVTQRRKRKTKKNKTSAKLAHFFLKSTKNKQQSGYMSVHKNQSNDWRNEKINWTSSFEESRRLN